MEGFVEQEKGINRGDNEKGFFLFFIYFIAKKLIELEVGVKSQCTKKSRPIFARANLSLASPFNTVTLLFTE